MARLNFWLRNLPNKTIFIFGNIWMILMVLINAGLVIVLHIIHAPVWFVEAMVIFVVLQAVFTFIVLKRVWGIRKQIPSEKVA